MPSGRFECPLQNLALFKGLLISSANRPVLAKHLPLQVTQLNKENFMLANKTRLADRNLSACPLIVPCICYAEKLLSFISPVISSFTVCAPGGVACHLTDTDNIMICHVYVYSVHIVPYLRFIRVGIVTRL